MNHISVCKIHESGASVAMNLCAVGMFVETSVHVSGRANGYDNTIIFVVGNMHGSMDVINLCVCVCESLQAKVISDDCDCARTMDT